MMRNKTLYEHQGIDKTLLWIFSIVGGAALANLYYCQALLNLISLDFGANEFTTNLVALFTQIGYTLGLVFVIPLADLFNRKKLLLGILFILMSALVFMGISPNIHYAIAMSLIVGMCSVVPQLFIPITAQYSDRASSAQNVSIVLSGALTGIVAARVIGGLVGECLGWRAIFHIAAVLMFLSIAVLYKRLPDMPVKSAGNYAGLLKSLYLLVRQYPVLRVASFRAACSFASFLAMWSCLAFKMVQPPFVADNTTIGLLGLSGIAGTVTTPIVGKYMKKFSCKSLTSFGCFTLLASWFSAYVGQNNYAGIIAGILLVNVGMSCVQICNQAYLLSMFPQTANRVNTVFVTSCFAGGSIGTLLAGTAWSFSGWTGVVIVGTALTLCAMTVNLCAKE